MINRAWSRYSFILTIVLTSIYSLLVLHFPCFATEVTQATKPKVFKAMAELTPVTQCINPIIISTISLLIGVLIGLWLRAEHRRKFKRICWTIWPPTLRKCTPRKDEFKTSPYIQDYSDFFCTVINSLIKARNRSESRWNHNRDSEIRSVKIMIGSPISGHGSVYCSDKWEKQSMNVAVRNDSICEFIDELYQLIRVSPNITKKIIYVKKTDLQDYIIDRLKFNSADNYQYEEFKRNYINLADKGYLWYKTKGFERKCVKDLHTLMIILEDVCCRKELISVSSQKEYFNRGHSHDFKCPGFRTHQSQLIKAYEEFYDELFAIAETEN